MCGMRIACGILAAGIVATAGAAPVAAVASQQPSGTPASQHPSETLSPLLKQPLPNVMGKTFTSVIVYFPPDARAVPHRHGSAFVYAYVLEGSVRSRLAGIQCVCTTKARTGSSRRVRTTCSRKTPAEQSRRSCWSSSSRTREPSSRSMISQSKAWTSAGLVGQRQQQPVASRSVAE